ncbi:aspartate/glutamate racemase family protein [Pseudomonas kuykendallii]|uniref:aspartate/glutamate racemase family protein n=1 Tax=Pseudomonas kuykendallii TaxID=1007099 RepID=UPI0028D2B4CA|nr:aspartate/glutamate racemase family protein [Pseudomonas kuykendallii]
MKYQVRPGVESYGHAIGILLIDCSTPFVPGDVGNASTYDYPVLYRTVPDVTLERLIEQGDESLVQNVIDTALELQRMGVRAITSDCGYMVRYQHKVAAALDTPVILSSLLQLPMIERTLGPQRKVGIICANARRLTPELLAIAGLSDPSRAVIRGLEDQPQFRGPILDETGTLDQEAVEAEVVAVAREMVATHPEVGAILLECSNLPPYAAAVQAVTGRLVFDFTTLIDGFQHASRRRRFAGIY